MKERKVKQKEAKYVTHFLASQVVRQLNDENSLSLQGRTSEGGSGYYGQVFAHQIFNCQSWSRDLQWREALWVFVMKKCTIAVHLQL